MNLAEKHLQNKAEVKHTQAETQRTISAGLCHTFKRGFVMNWKAVFLLLVNGTYTLPEEENVQRAAGRKTFFQIYPLIPVSPGGSVLLEYKENKSWTTCLFTCCLAWKRHTWHKVPGEHHLL